jgi:hypothetical protein
MVRGLVVASIHSAIEQQEATNVCALAAGLVDGQPSGCWIGLGDRSNEGEFSWSDNSAMDW